MLILFYHTFILLVNSLFNFILLLLTLYIYTVLYSIYILINSRSLESWRGLYRQLLYIYTHCNTVIFPAIKHKKPDLPVPYPA
nr:MAG TPA: hypothetical protein [Caudoviricetes sp.]